MATCRGFTKDGKRCQSKNVQENGYCPHHQDQAPRTDWERVQAWWRRIQLRYKVIGALVPVLLLVSLIISHWADLVQLYDYYRVTPTATLPATPLSNPAVLSTPTVTAVPTEDWLPADWASLEAWLSKEWRSATPADLVESRLRSDWELDYASFVGTITLADIDGDARAEWALSFFDPGYPSDHASGYGIGELLIVGDGGVIYRYHGQSRYESSSWPRLPTVKYVEDLTNDSLSDIVIEAKDCGANTCLYSYRVLSYATGKLENVVWNQQNYLDEIVMATAESFISDSEANGNKKLYVHGGYFGSVGAAINIEQRGYTEIWSWNPQIERLTLKEVVEDPSGAPFYHLLDANRLLESDDPSARERAAEAYTILVEQQYQDVEDEQAHWEFIQQFSAFRLAYIALETGDLETALRWKSWLSERFPQSIVPRLTRDLIANWEQVRDLPLACILAVESAREGDFVSPYEGYAVPQLGKNDLCPVTK